MEIVVDVRGPAVVVLRPFGRLDLVSAVEFKRKLLRTIDTGHRQQVIDLGEVTFIDSSGLGALIAGLKSTRQVGGDLRIARPNEQACTVLRLTTLDRVLRPYATLADALVGFDV